jgi:cell division protein ZapA (FtsZ GTPase activity inhibitor)
MNTDSCEIELYGQIFHITDAKGEAHLREAVAALHRRVQQLQETTGSISPFRVVLMAALSAEAELLAAPGQAAAAAPPLLSFS